MNTISDDDLVLYHYRDGLDATRLDEIRDTLVASQALRDRLASIVRQFVQILTDRSRLALCHCRLH